jgi:MoxR-like ATPase
MLDPFIGREEEMRDVIKNLLLNRIVTLTGPSGIGKSSMVKNIANFMHDRR